MTLGRYRPRLALVLVALVLGAQAPATHLGFAQEKTDPSKLTPDQRADKAIGDLEGIKSEIAKVLDGPCPKNEADWQEWKKKAMSLLARALAVGGMGDELKKDGASKEKLEAFEKARGTKAEQKAAQEKALNKAVQCAESAGAKEYKEIMETTDITEQVKKGKAYVDDMKAQILHRANLEKQEEAKSLGLAVVTTIKESKNCKECAEKGKPDKPKTPAAGGEEQKK